jgi:hypothetical protein
MLRTRDAIDSTFASLDVSTLARVATPHRRASAVNSCNLRDTPDRYL